MELIGKTVEHITFGRGIIIDNNSHIFEVDFSGSHKKFHFPEAFSRFVSMTDKTSQAYVNTLLKGVIKTNKKRQEDALLREERLRKIRALKISPNSQAVFGLVQNNRDDISDSWSISTGQYLSGYSKGKPRIPSRLRLNSACLLTERLQGAPEVKREIIGAFMVPEDFEGNACKDGMIESHEVYRILLNRPHEKMMFWDYFSSSSQSPKWGNTEMKYFSNTLMKQILKDMKKIAKNQERKEFLQQFYQYFCEVNRLDLSEENNE